MNRGESLLRTIRLLTFSIPFLYSTAYEMSRRFESDPRNLLGAAVTSDDKATLTCIAIGVCLAIAVWFATYKAILFLIAILRSASP